MLNIFNSIRKLIYHTFSSTVRMQKKQLKEIKKPDLAKTLFVSRCNSVKEENGCAVEFERVLGTPFQLDIFPADHLHPEHGQREGRRRELQFMIQLSFPLRLQSVCGLVAA